MWKLDPTTKFDYDEQNMHVPILGNRDHMFVISCNEDVINYALVLLNGMIGYVDLGLIDKVF